MAPLDPFRLLAALCLAGLFYFFPLFVDAGKQKITRVRLPAENELANSCYFTYRMNFIICDQSLSSEQAAEAIQKGECHSDYKIMGSDFQVVGEEWVHREGVPPLEASFWMIGMPETRTMEECPGIMILSYVVIAEAALFLHGPKNEIALGFMRDAVVISKTMKYRDVVTESWPVNGAFASFQKMFNAVTEQMSLLGNPEVPGNLAKGVAKNLGVDVIVCRCGSESLLDLQERLKLIDRKETRVYIQEVCFIPTEEEQEKEGSASPVQPLASAPKTQQDLEQLMTSFYPNFRHIKSTAILSRACTPILPGDLEVAEYTIFLGRWASERQKNVNPRYHDLVYRSFEINTFLISDFLHLGNIRSLGEAEFTPCQKAVAKQMIDIRGGRGSGGETSSEEDAANVPIISTYRGELFVVRRDPLMQLREIGLQSEICAPIGMGSAWHVMFGKPPLLPTHEDDITIPTFLRTLDEESSATLPKKFSNYLTYVE